jgi:AbrB family looped-hinge helix DNA binding protein
MHFTTMTQKGQITLPVDFRNNLHLMPGDSFKCTQTGDEIIIKKTKKPTLMDLSGCLPKPKRAMTHKDMEEGIGRAVSERMRRCTG